MKKGMYEFFKRIEEYGDTCVRDVFYIVLNKAAEDKDLSKMNDLYDTVNTREFFASKEMRPVYSDLLAIFMRWLKEKCVVGANGDIVAFKGE